VVKDVTQVVDVVDEDKKAGKLMQFLVGLYTVGPKRERPQALIFASTSQAVQKVGRTGCWKAGCCLLSQHTHIHTHTKTQTQTHTHTHAHIQIRTHEHTCEII
jgi:hypothetical protein